MNSKDVDSVMEIITSSFRIDEQSKAKLKRKLRRLELPSQSQTQTKETWITQARDVARTIASRNGEVTIEDVLHEFPLSDDADPRIVGGVLRHPDFERIGNRTLMARDRRYKTVGVFQLRNNVLAITDWD